MNIRISKAILWFGFLCAAPIIAQEAPVGQEQDGAVIQTPFGPVPVQIEAPTEVQADAVPAAAAVEQEEADDSDAPISLILDNADIYQVIRIIGDALALNYVIDPAVQGTVNISTSDTLRTSDLLPLLETILKINGATMIQTGNFYQIVPANTAVREPVPLQNDVPEQVALDDRIVIQVVRMRYVAATEMSQLLTPYLSDAGNIVVYDSGNILLVSERRGNLRKLLDIVDIFDAGAFEGERVRMFPVENAFPSDLIPDLRSIFAGYALSGEMTAIRFVPIERLNSILVVTPNASVFSEVGEWLERLDQPLQSGGVQNFVYRVRNSKAADLQRVLAQLYGGNPFAAPIPATLAGTGPGQIGSPAGTVQPAPSIDSTILQQNIRVVADPITHSLIIQATPQEYAEIERTLSQLDILARQVLIDAQIYEVVLDDSLSFGVSATLQNRGTLANPQTTASFTNGGLLAAQTFAYVGRARELLAFLNASENRSRVRTISAPSVLVSDNMVASFEVGADIPVPTTSAVNPAAGGTDIFAFAQTIQFRTTGVILRVLPQITASGRVTLSISQEVSQAGPNTTSGIVAPVIGKSSVDSTIVVQDGQTIALGGFIRENSQQVESRVPLIGRVPVLGALFGSTSNSTTRTELIILITPHVIRDTEEADQATEELKQKLKEIQEIIE